MSAMPTWWLTTSIQKEQWSREDTLETAVIELQKAFILRIYEFLESPSRMSSS